MVYESREGEVVLLGASSWRIESIGHDRVLVTPAPGEPGKVPFWKGDGVGRPVELGRELGAFTREIGRARSTAKGAAPGGRARCASSTTSTSSRPRTCCATSTRSSRRRAPCPTDRTIVVERFRDELGDWRVCVLTPVRGARPRAVGAGDRGAAARGDWASRSSRSGRTTASSSACPRPTRAARRGGERPARDGWRPRGPAAGTRPIGRAHRLRRDRGAGDRRSSGRRRCSRAASGRTRRARCCCRAAGPASGRRCGRCASARRSCWRSPAATARSRSSSRRTGSASRTSSTCPRCATILGAIERREVRVVSVETSRASPFASSLLFDYIAAYMYEGDAPLARPARAGADARPGPAARAAGRGGAARAARRRRARGPRARAPGPDAGASGRLGRRGPRPPAPARRPDERRGGGARPRRRRACPRAGRRGVAGGARRRPARGRGADRAASSAGSRPRTSAATAMRSASSPPRGRAGRVPGADARCAGRRCSPAGRASHGPFLTDEPATRWRLPRGVVEYGARGAHGARACCCAASSGPAASSASGATRRCCGCSAAARWPGCAARSSRWSRPRSARFLPAWQGVGGRPSGSTPHGGHRPARGPADRRRASSSATSCRRGCAATTRDARRARCRRRGRLGRARSLGRDDGRVVLYRPDRLALLRADAAARRCAHRRGRWVDPRGAARAARGAGAPRSTASSRRASSRRRPPAAGAGRPSASSSTRSGTSSGPARSPTTRSRRSARCAGRARRPSRRPARPRVGARDAPRAARGGGSLVARGGHGPHGGGARGRPGAVRDRASRGTGAGAAGAPRRPHAGRGRRGGRRRRLRAVYPVLREMEERGRVRRGYFVEGLGGAQFALPGAVDRLRAARGARRRGDRVDQARTVVLAATDPANPYGAALPWPRDEDARQPLAVPSGRRVRRARRRRPVLYLERGGRSLLTFRAFDDARDRRAGARGARRPRRRRAACGASRSSAWTGRGGDVAARGPRLDALGFRQAYRGLVLRAADPVPVRGRR